MNRIVTKFYEKYLNEIDLTTKIEAYIQYILIRKTLESISSKYRREGFERVMDKYEILIKIKNEKMKPLK